MMNNDKTTCVAETTEQIPLYPEDDHKYSGLLEED